MVSKRRHKRIQVVLPVRVIGQDISGKPFTELAHTLDITCAGARLGAIHHHVKPGDAIKVQYRQRSIQFRIVWIQLLEGSSTEYQIGLEAVTPVMDAWGLESREKNLPDDYMTPATS
jgi:hypothetical protein